MFSGPDLDPEGRDKIGAPPPAHRLEDVTMLSDLAPNPRLLLPINQLHDLLRHWDRSSGETPRPSQGQKQRSFVSIHRRQAKTNA